VVSGEHAKREMGTGEKTKSSGRKSDEGTLSREDGDKHKEESASSIKSHRKGDTKKENEDGGQLRDRLFITFHLLRRVHHFKAPRA
jgi:hypothetical protein